MKIYFELLIAYIIFLLLAVFVKGGAGDEFVTVILSMSTFLFAILLAFSTANRHKRLDSIRTALRDDDAVILSLYNASKMFGKKVQEECRKKIDAYLIAQLDYKLEDYNKSTQSLLVLYDFILNLKTKTEPQRFVKAQMLDDFQGSLKNQKEVIYWVKDKMQLFEWLSISALCAIIIFSLFSMNNGSSLAIIIIPIISVSLILLMLVLRDLNKLKWQEGYWIWMPLIEMFQEIDLLPYFPEPSFKSRRLKRYLPKGTEYRIASYPNRYPDLTGKQVRIVKN